MYNLNSLRQSEVEAVSSGGRSLSASAAWTTGDKDLERNLGVALEVLAGLCPHPGCLGHQ